MWTDLNRQSRRASLLKHLTKQSLFETCLLTDKKYSWGEEEFNQIVLRGSVRFPATRKEIEDHLGIQFKGELGVFSGILREDSTPEIELELLLYNNGRALRGWGDARIKYNSSKYLAIAYEHVHNGEWRSIGWDSHLEDQSTMDNYEQIEQNQQKIDLLVREVDKILALAESALLAHLKPERGR